MRFYYFSLFSWMAYGIAVLVAVTLLSILWTRLLKFKLRNPVYWILVAAIFVLPWAEELWIAYNFDRLCRKDAGIFINKTVEVDGFYDDTGGGSLDLVRSGTYRFIESRSDGSYTRLTLGDSAFMQEALERFKKTSPGRDPATQDVIRVNVDERTQALVFPQRGDVLRVTRLEKPTARYHYTTPQQSTPTAYKIRKTERLVTDSQSGEVLARETVYARSAFWFFISLGAPAMLCKDVDQRTSPSIGSIYNASLRPIGKQ